MENASQALLIAAGVLIGVVILSLAVYLGNVMGDYAANTQNRMDESTLAQFNTEFMKYNGLTNLTIQDIITIKNYALENNKENNASYDYNIDHAGENNDYVDVYYADEDTSQILAFAKSDEELLTQAIDKEFTCTVVVNATTGRVNKVFFSETKS